jgi:hypothetical protein
METVKSLFSWYSLHWFFFLALPEPKVQGELLVSKGDTPASGVMLHASTIIFFFQTDGKIYLKFGLSIFVTSTLKFAHAISIGPF